MAKALIVKINTMLEEISKEEMRQYILRQYHEGGVIVLDNGIKHEVVEFDAVQVNGSSPVGSTNSELFGEIDGHSIYVVRDEYGRIVVDDECMRELIERASGSSPKDFRKTPMYKEMLAHVRGESDEQCIRS